MAKPILLDDYRNVSYAQIQDTNNKLDRLIEQVSGLKEDIGNLKEDIRDIKEEMRDMKQDIKALDTKIDDTRKELEEKITDVRKEFKEEINILRWHTIGIIVTQICSVGAIVWAVVSALK